MKKLLFFFSMLTLLCLSGAVKAQETLPVYEDETATSNNAPIRSGSGSQTEFVYPASLLANMEGGTITSVKFFLSSVYSNSYAGTTITVYMQEVEGTVESVSAWQYNQNTATKVYEGTTLSVTNSELVITFSTPYEYNGGNLCFNIWSSSTAPTNYFYGKSTDYVSCVYDYSITPPVNKPWSSGSAKFLPKAEFTYEPVSTCEKPATLESSSVTTTGATLTWTGGSGTYNLEVKGGSYTDWTSVLSNTSFTTTTLTPLDPETQYQVRVQSVCGEEVSGWKTTSFTTPCGILSTFPKTYTFETSDGFPSNASTPTTNQLGNCWRNEATVKSGSYSTRVWGTSTSYKKNGSQSLVLPNKGNGSKTMLVFPAMDFTSTNGYVVSFWIYRSGSSTSPEGFKVYASDCDTIGANAIELGHYSRNYNIAYPQVESASGWYYYETSPITMTGTTYIIFEGQSYFSSATYVDDITIKVAPNCLKPTGLEANNVTTHSADLSWTANSGETAWTLYYKKTSDENYTEVSNVTENPYTLPSLDHSSNYQFYVVANCSATDNSEASDMKTFSTECAAISADGYSANFDDYTAGNNVLPLCWRPINTTTNSSYTGYPKIYNYNANSPSNCLYLYSYAYYSGGSTTSDPQPQYAILPEMTDLAGKQITLQARGYYTSSTFKVGTMSDPTDASTFTEITGSPDNPAAITTSYQEYIFYIPSNTTDRYVAIMIEAANSSRTTNGVYIDDIVFSVAPTCWRTQNLAASNVTNESATLTWQRHAMGEETAWVLQYGTDENFGDGTYTEVTPSTNPTYTIENGLAATTTYYVRVKPACDNNGNLWSDTISFETEASCMIPNSLVISDVTAHGAFLTWNGNNDSYNLRYRKATTAPVFFNETYDFEDNSLQGWTTISNDNDNNAWTIQSGSSDAHQSYYYARSRYTSSGDGVANDWLISPQIPLGGTFSFYAKRYSTSYTDQFQVYVSTTGTEISDFTAISEVITPNATYDPYEYDLSAYSGYGYVAIVYTAPNNQYYVYVDDIHITATIPGVFDEWQTVNNATKPYPFSDLDAETYYEAQVNGYCNSSSTTTDWSNPISFTTAIACPAPTNLAYSNVTAHTADLTWNVNSNPTTNYVLTKNGEESNIVVTINEGVASYALTELNGETEYTVSVHANCGTEDGSSMESNEVTFTTPVSCAIPTGLEAVSETTSSIKLHWTANNNESAWVVAHKIDGADQFTEVPVAQSDLDGDGNYNLTDLADGKTYTIKVRANCGVTDGLSQWSSEITHATAASCTTPTNLTVSDVNGHGATISWTDAPVEGKNYIVMVASENMALNVDFENNSIPSNFTNDATYPWYVYTGTDCTTKAMRSSNNGVNSSTSAIEVTVNVTEPSTLSFDFWSRGEGSDGNDWDKSRFYIDGTIVFDYGAHDAWESYNGPITAGTHTLKWEFKKDGTQAGTGDCFYVDNIKITAGASAFVEKDPTTATSLELNDLDPETTYYVKVKGDCGSATSPESGVETFTTPAACNAPTSLTYDDESVTAHTVDLRWTENNGATAWKVIYSKVNIDNSEITVDINENNVITDGTTITYTLTGLDGQTAYIAHVKSNCGGVHNDISAESISTSFITLPACYPVGDVITSDITAYTVTVHWSDYYNAGAYIVKQGDNVLDGTTTPSVVIDATNHTATISGLEPEHTYTNGTFTVFADCGTEGMSTGTKVPSFQTEPSCHPVTNVNITGKTPNSVTFTWEDTHTPDTYIIKEGENVLTDETAHSVVIDATNLTATISGLDENETYSAGTFKVFADCGTTDGQSAGVNVPAFTTPCSAHNTFPWTENFNDLNTANTIPDCWNNDEGTTSTASYKWCYTTGNGNGGCNGTSHDNSNCVRFNSFTGSHVNYLKSIPLSLPNDQPMQLKFWYKNPTGGDFSVYISTDGGATHETALATGLTGVSDWTEHDPINLSAYAGQEVVLVFKGTSNNGNGNAYIYLDDVTVEEAPACAAPTALGATAITNNSATLNWTANSGETDWTLYYKKTSEENYTVVTENVTNPYMLAVDAATEYIYYVVANCSATTTSDPSATYTFTTKCNLMTITAEDYIDEDFESYEGKAYNVKEGVVVPDCWDKYSEGTTYVPHVVSGTSYNYYHSDSQSLNLIGEGNSSAYVALPTLTNDLNTLMVNFWMKTEGTASNYKLSLGYITAADVNYNTYQVIEQYDNTTTVTERTTDLSTKNIPAEAARLVFRFYHSGNSWHACCIDDIKVSLAPTCKAVSGLTVVEPSAYTVALSWTPGASQETNWKLQYRENGYEEWNTIDVSENDLNEGVYTLDQLSAETTYNWQVAAACSNTDISEYIAGANFTTLEACPAPAGLAADNATQNTVDLSWNATDAQTYNIQYRTAADIDIILSEDFNDGIGDWTMQNCDNNTGISNNMFRFRWNTNPPQYLISPEINVEEAAILEFDYKNESTNYPETFKVGFSSTTNSPDAFTWSDEYSAGDVSWHTYTGVVPVGTKYISIQCTSNNKYYLYIDNIVAGIEIPAGQWQSASTTDNTPSLQLPNLTSNTKYEVQVQGVCDNTPGAWSSSVNFTTEAIPEYTVTFVAGNSGSCSTPELTGITVELPTATPLDECVNNGWTFAGWSETELTENTTTSPTTLYEAGSTYTPATDINLYAVYKRTEGEAVAASYNLVTEEPADWSGEYLIAYTTTSVVFKSSQADLDANNAMDISQYREGNTIASNATTDAVKVTIASTGNGKYSLLAANGKYFGNTSTSNALVSRTSPAIDNTISLDASGNAVIESNSTYLRMNTGSGTYGRFRYYGSGQQPIQLYRYTSATPVTYASTPDCSIPVSYNIIVTQVQGATITAPSTAFSGDVIQLSIDLEEGYALNQWQVTASTGPVTVSNNTFEMPAANVNVTATLFNVYTVTANTVPSNGGTVTGAGSYNENTEVSLTANANDGYDFTGWYNGNEQVSVNNTYTFTVTGNVTLEARFAARHTVTFNSGNGTCTTTSLEGSTIDLSNVVAVPSELCSNQGWTFAGWSETNVNETTTAPTMVNTIYSPASDIELHAVYSKTETGAGADTWTKATSIATGDVVVIVNENASKELTGIHSNNYGVATNYTTLPAGTYPLTVEQGYADNSYAFKNNSNYLALTSAGNSLYQIGTLNKSSSWTVSFNSDGDAVIYSVNYTQRVIRYNISSPRFACYEGTQQPVQLYKLVPGDVTTYNSNPECISSYVITAEANNNSYGTVTGTVFVEGDFVSGNAYAENTQITLTATANEGYSFINWTKDGVEVTNGVTYSFPVTEDAAYVANFTLSSYEITATVNPIEGGSVTGANTTYNHGTTAILTAVPSENYHFVNWTESDTVVTGAAAEYSFTVTGARSLIANFALDIHTVTVSVAPDNAGTVTGLNATGEYVHGSSVTLTASPNGNYLFTNWTVNGNVVSSSYEYNFTVNENMDLVANFTAMGTVANPNFNPGEGTYYVPQNVELSCATPGSTIYYTIDGSEPTTESSVYSNAIAINETTTIKAMATADNMVHSAVVSATYRIVPKYDVVITSDIPYGSVTADPMSDTTGATITLTANPATGYHFESWHVTSGNSVIAVNNDSFIMPAGNVNVNATFVPDTHMLTINYVAAGTTAPATYTHNYAYGAAYSVTSPEVTGYTPDITTVIGTMGTSDVNVNVTYTVNSYEITATVEPTNSGSVQGAGSYNYGTTATLTATAVGNFLFEKWTEDDTLVSVNPEFSFTVEGPRNFVARFVAMGTVATPTFSPVAGTYNVAQSVTLSCATSGATIHYTTDGTEPTEQSSVFTPNQPIMTTADGNTTIKAIAMKNDMINSEVATATYHIMPLYNVLVSGNIANGTVSADPTTDTTGATITLTANPATGYHFESWHVTSGNSVIDVNNDSFIMPAGNVNVSATFVPDTHMLTINYVATGTTAPATYTHNYAYGDAYSVTSPEVTGYTPDITTVSGTMGTSDVNVTVTYNVNNYEITVTAEPTNGGSVTGDGNYNYGATATLTATAVGNFLFEKWTEDDTLVSVNPEFSFTVEGPRAFVAHFVAMGTVVTPTFSPVAGTYNVAQSVTLSCSTTGATIHYTTDGTEPTEQSSVFTPNQPIMTTADGNTTIKAIAMKTGMINSAVATATYHIMPLYNVLVSGNIANGNVIADPTTDTAGATIALTANPATGYHFESWHVTSGNSVIAVNNDSFIMPAGDVNVNATFVPDTHMLTINYVAAGTTAPATYTHNYAYGAAYSVTSPEVTGYTPDITTVSGTMGTSDVNVTVTYTVNSYNITATAEPTNSGSVQGAGSYNYGATATLTATAAGNFLFEKWTENDTLVSVNPEFSFTVEGPRNFVARFVAMGTVATPTFSPAGGTYNTLQNVTLSCTTEGATIYYTTDSSEPDAQSSIYTEPIATTDNGTTVIKAIAMKTNMLNSAVATATYVIKPLYDVTISNTITNGTVTANPMTAVAGTTIDLTATPATGYHFGEWTVTTTAAQTVTVTNNSFVMPEGGALVSATFQPNSYAITATANPTAGGSVTGTNFVSGNSYDYGTGLSLTATPADNYLFTNWTENSNVVSDQATYSFTVTSERNLVANFTAMGTVATPSFSPAGGTYNTLQNVTLSCTTEGATIYYTTDGTEPTVNSSVYNSAISTTDNGTTVIKAIAMKTNMLNSAVATATYVIKPLYDVTISNTITNGTVTANPMTAVAGTTINLTATPATGYHFGEWTVTTTAAQTVTVTNNSFEMPEGGALVSATFQPNSYNLTINYKYTDGTTAAETHTESVNYNANYSVASPAITGYTPNQTTVSGTMGTADVTVDVTYSINSYNLTVNYKYANGTTAAETHTESVNYNANYSVASPAITGYTPDVATVSGTMGTADVTVDVTYSINSHTLTINYKYTNGTTATATHTESVNYNANYSVASPVIEGYTPDIVTVTGTMPDENVTVNVTYGTDVHTLTIHYVYATGGTAHADEVRHIAYGVDYSIASPAITGYTPDVATVSGTMGTADVTVNVTYIINSYNLTVNYKYADGTTAATTHTESVNYNSIYSVTSPQIAAYVANQTTVTGTMGTEAVTKTVTYYLVETNIVDASNCSGNGNGSITVTAPLGNYEYSIDGTNYQSETAFSNLSNGNYNLYIRPTGEEYNYVGAWSVGSNITMPVAIVSSNDSVFCLNSSIQLSGNGSSTGSDYSYAWSGPASYSSTDMTPAAFEASDANMSGVYTLTVTDNATNCASSQSLNINVNTPANTDYVFTIRGFNAVGNLELGQSSTTANILNPIVTHYMDNIIEGYSTDSVTLENDAPAEYTASGIYNVIWTATDACGNTATCSIIVTISEDECASVQDIDGNIYQSVKIGSNCWMTENLRTTRYADGRPITNVYKYQYSEYPDPESNVTTFGMLYDWYDALDSNINRTRSTHKQGICPTGWHIPSDVEFEELVNTDLNTVRSTDYWLYNAGNNASGFNLKPAGMYNDATVRYENLLGNTYLWSTVSLSSTTARCYAADCFCYMMYELTTSKTNAYSVRCIKNN